MPKHPKKESTKNVELKNLDLYYIGIFTAVLLGYMNWQIAFWINEKHAPWDGSLLVYLFSMFICGVLVASIAPNRYWSSYLGVLSGQAAAMIILPGIWPQDAIQVLVVGSLFVFPGVPLGSAIHGSYIQRDSQVLRDWVEKNKHKLQAVGILVTLVMFPRLLLGTVDEALVAIVDSETGKPLSGVHVVYSTQVKEGTLHGHGGGTYLSIRERISDKDGKIRFKSVWVRTHPFGWSTIPRSSQLILFKENYIPRTLSTPQIFPAMSVILRWPGSDKTIKLARERNNEEYVNGIGSIGSSIRYMVERETPCPAQNMKRMIFALNKAAQELYLTPQHREGLQELMTLKTLSKNCGVSFSSISSDTAIQE